MLLLSAAVVFILLLGLGLLHTPPVQRFVFERLRALLLDRSAIDIQASGFRFSLFGRDITLEDLRVRSSSAPDLPPLFQAERISVQLNVRNIVKGFWDLEVLKVTAPKIHYYVGPDGQSNLPEIGSRAGGTLDYLITRGEVRNGSFRYEDLRKEVAFELPRWQLLLDGKRPTRTQVCFLQFGEIFVQVWTLYDPNRSTESIRDAAADILANRLRRSGRRRIRSCR